MPQPITLVYPGNNNVIVLDSQDYVVDAHVGTGNSVTAGDGTDSVLAGAGNDTVSLGSGADTVSVGGGNNTVTLGGGNDYVDASLGMGNLISAGDGNDTVLGGTGADTIRLGSGKNTVTVSGNGNKITVGGGANTLNLGTGTGDSVTAGDGNNTVSGSTGNTTVKAGSGANAVTLGGMGNVIDLGAGANTVVAGSGNDSVHLAGGTFAVTFAGTGNTLTYDANVAAGDVITGLAAGDTLNLTGENTSGVTGASIVGGNILRIMRAGGGFTDIMLKNFAGGTVQMLPGPMGQGVVIQVMCFVAGTRIATSDGPVAVENLAPGDLIRVRHPAAGLRALRWIGHRRVALDAHPDPELVAPIRVAAGAFAPGIPERDLLLSPDHAVFTGGMLVPIRQLVNGATITGEPASGTVDYHHLEFAAHEIVAAEGLAVESLRPGADRAFFANAPDGLVQHRPIPESGEDGPTIVPIIRDADAVRPVWQALAARAEQLGFVAPAANWTEDAAARLVTDGAIIAPLVDDGRLLIFALPPGLRTATLVSRADRPTARHPWLDDRRRLGLQVSALQIDTPDGPQAVPLDHPMLTEGWWQMEQDGSACCRWTTGAASVPLRPDASLLRVVLRGRATFAADAAPAAIARRRA